MSYRVVWVTPSAGKSPRDAALEFAREAFDAPRTMIWDENAKTPLFHLENGTYDYQVVDLPRQGYSAAVYEIRRLEGT